MRRGDDVKHLPSFYFASGRRYLGNRWCRTERSEWHHRHISEASGTTGTSAKRVAPSAHQRSEWHHRHISEAKWHHRRHGYNHHYKRGINLSRHKQIRDASFHFTASTTSLLKYRLLYKFINFSVEWHIFVSRYQQFA